MAELETQPMVLEQLPLEKAPPGEAFRLPRRRLTRRCLSRK